MKKIFLTLLAMCTMLAYADDIIVMRNSEKINAKILEVSDTEIKYKKSNSLDGPTYTTRTSQINTIIYESGDVQVYNQPAAQPASSGVAYSENNDGQPVERTKSWRFEPSEKRNFGLTMGWTTKQFKYKEGGETEKGSIGQLLGGDEKNMTHGFSFGFLANPTFKYGLGVRTGLIFEYYHEKYTGENPSNWNAGDYTAHLHDFNFSIPAQLSFRMEVARDFSLLIYTGPVFDLGVYGFTKIEDEKSDNLYGKDVWSDKWEGFNCLWGIGGGLQYKFLRLDVGGEFGMMEKFGVDNLKLNKPIYINLAFMF